MKIARVFPTKTSMSPNDKDVYFDAPDLFTPIYDEVHISVTFTWDIGQAEKLAEVWGRHGKIRIGGVAINGESDQPFQSGMYLKKGITITSRGCPNHCKYCMVNKGHLIEFDDFPEGNIVQDNNLLACSDHHQELVWSMLKKQKAIELKGGLQSSRVTSKIAETLRGLRIKSLWLACDYPEAVKPLRKAVEILNRAGFTRNLLFCYVLIGKDMVEEENRLRFERLFAWLKSTPNESDLFGVHIRQTWRKWCDLRGHKWHYHHETLRECKRCGVHERYLTKRCPTIFECPGKWRRYN